MGVIGSRLSSLGTVQMMPTDWQFKQRDKMQEQWYTAQAVGQLQAGQVQAQSLGISGTSGALNIGMGLLTWSGFIGGIQKLATFMVPLLFVASLILYALQLPQTYMFLITSLLFTVFYVAVSVVIPSLKLYIPSGLLFWVSLMMGTGTGAFISFMVYNPNGDGDGDTKKDAEDEVKGEGGGPPVG